MPACISCRGEGIYVPPRGPVDSVCVVLGESPGRVESQAGRPFVGPSGQFLSTISAEVDFPLGGCYITNSCKMFVEGKPNPKARDLRNCIDSLRAEIEAHERVLIVGFGNVAGYACGVLKGVGGITGVRGRILDSHFKNSDGSPIPCLLTFHPAAILRGGGGEMATLFRRDLSAAVDYLKTGERKTIGELPPIEIVEDTESGVLRVIEDSYDSGWLAIDIETDGLDPFADSAKIVGISMSGNGVRAVFARSREAQDYACRMIRDVIDRGVRTVGHNVKYDGRWLHLFYDMPRDMFSDDTMVMYSLLAEEGVARSSGDDHIRSGLKLLAETFLGWPRYSDRIQEMMNKRPYSSLLQDLGALERAVNEPYLSVVRSALEKNKTLSSSILRSEILESGIDASPWGGVADCARAILGSINEYLSPLPMSQMPVDLVCEYACRDAQATWLLSQVLTDLMRKDGVLETYERVDRVKIRAFARMMHRPIYVDLGLIREFKVPLDAEIARHTAKMRSISKSEDLNPSSYVQIRSILYEKLGCPVRMCTEDTGVPSTSESALEDLLTCQISNKAREFIESLLEHRRLSKLSSAYVEQLQSLARVHNGRYAIWPEINLASVATGRVSMARPNLQQMVDELKGVILPPPGYVVISVDARQAEPRVAAMYSRDQDLIKLFAKRQCPQCGRDYEGVRLCPDCGVENTPADVYAELFRAVYNRRHEAKEERDVVKRVFLATMYGQSAKSTAEQLGIGEGEAEKVLYSLRRNYPDFFGFFSRLRVQALTPPHEVKSFYGRKRRLSAYMTSGEERTREDGIRRALNSPIQSASSDMIALMIDEADRRFAEEGLDAWPAIFVHDSITYFARSDHAGRVIDVVKDVMTTSPFPEVMLDVDVKVDLRWGARESVLEYFSRGESDVE